VIPQYFFLSLYSVWLISILWDFSSILPYWDGKASVNSRHRLSDILSLQLLISRCFSLFYTLLMCFQSLRMRLGSTYTLKYIWIYTSSVYTAILCSNFALPFLGRNTDAVLSSSISVYRRNIFDANKRLVCATENEVVISLLNHIVPKSYFFHRVWKKHGNRDKIREVCCYLHYIITVRRIQCRGIFHVGDHRRVKQSCDMERLSWDGARDTQSETW